MKNTDEENEDQAKRRARKKRAQLLKNEVTRKSNTKKRDKEGKLIGIELRDWMKKLREERRNSFDQEEKQN